MKIEHFGLYLVITHPVTSYEICAEAAVRAGLRYLQLRIKKSPRDAILPIAKNLRAITQGTKTRFIINDDPQLAVESGADGVHLGQEDLSISEARIRFPSLRIFGLSTHNPEQARAAVDSHPDYIGVGPVYATPTKEIPDPALGPEQAGAIIRSTPLTTVAIGGIHAENIRAVRKEGAINFAVVRPVCLSTEPFDAIRRLQDLWFSE